MDETTTTRVDRKLTVDVRGDRNVALAWIEYDGIEAAGSAKRVPGDRFNQRVGERLALGRAFVSLGQSMQARAHAENEAENPAAREEEA